MNKMFYALVQFFPVIQFTIWKKKRRISGDSFFLPLLNPFVHIYACNFKMYTK